MIVRGVIRSLFLRLMGVMRGRCVELDVSLDYRQCFTSVQSNYNRDIKWKY